MSVLIISLGLFAIGLYGVLTRRDIVALFASIEVMIGGALVLLVGLGAASQAHGARIEGLALLIVVAAAAEAAIGLALLVAVARRRGTTRADELTEVKG